MSISTEHLDLDIPENIDLFGRVRNVPGQILVEEYQLGVVGLILIISLALRLTDKRKSQKQYQ